MFSILFLLDLDLLKTAVCNSYTTVCPAVLGDNSRALESELSPVQEDRP